jgi:pyruvate, water dikinase
MSEFIRWFADLGNHNVAEVGGKNASLGELYSQLTGQGLKVPNGFAVTAHAYRTLLADHSLREQLQGELEQIDLKDTDSLSRHAQCCRDLVYDAPLPDALVTEILDAHQQLLTQYGDELTVAVRSSATAEDLPQASFAGQHDSYLNVRGGAALLDACRRCFASLFTERAIQYRAVQGFAHLDVALSIGVMKMVRADLGASGVIFTIDTESGFDGVVLVTGAYGLGENIVQGMVDPDEFYVHKATLAQGHRAVLRRHLGSKKIRMIYGSRRGGGATFNEPTSAAERARFSITDAEVISLAEQAVVIENHFSQLAGVARPMDIEWAKDGLDGELYILQARPETVASQHKGNILERYHLRDRGPIIVSGRAVGTRATAGRVRVARTQAELSNLREGEVLVAETTTPDWGSVMRRAAALVTNRGGRTCHAAIVARELNIPAVVGCADATEKLKTGDEVTVACCEGETGRVYAGRLPVEIEQTDLSGLTRPRTKIMVNLGDPDLAFKTAMIPCDGVGLARLEFIITEYVKVHPMALAHPEQVTDPDVRAAISKLTAGYASPADFFIERLSEGVGTIAAAFYPKPVVVRLSDFKTNEYAQLLGGQDFEPDEENPMLGFRGASRYAHPAYADGFALECAAMRRVREYMGLTNLKLMIPFCRRVDEARRVLEVMAEHGLKRGEQDLEVYVMCEIPNNVILIDEFAQLFDGFSIGSNDLTQLTLGVDRDSDQVAFDFDERDPGVLKMLEMAVVGAHRNQRHSGICGQAPSDYPEVAEFLVRLGIDSLSLNPDSVLPTTLLVLALEKTLSAATMD